MIDLHTHTNFSDGTWNLKELLIEAKKRKIEIISITDHDTIKAYEELEKINYKDYFLGDIKVGVELNTVFDGVAFHMLAYDFDYKKIKNWVFENYENKKTNLEKEFNLMIENCKKIKLK